MSSLHWSQTANGVPTNYTLDLNAGLTQVLADRSDTYLYGNGRIAQYQTAMQYFGADGLGSVRQIYNSTGQVVANTRYDPFGNVLSQSGSATSMYGFTGEATANYIKRKSSVGSQDGHLPVFRLDPGHRVMRVRKADLEKFIDAHIQTGAAVPASTSAVAE